jgi:serine/threonine protein kinase
MERLIDSKVLNPSPFLMRLRRAAAKNKNAICSDTRVFYLIFEKPYQTLKEECINRRIKGGRFSEEEVACILESCVKGLHYLKEMSESHKNISTSSIFLREDRTVILGDPWVLGENSLNISLYGFTYPSP